MTGAQWRVWRVGLTVVFSASLVLFGLLQVVQDTVLQPSWYQEMLDENDAYDRIYDRVLVDPEFASTVDDLTTGLPFDRSLIEANLRIVIPPATLRGTLERALTQLTDYLEQRTDEIDLAVTVRDVKDNLEHLNRRYAADVIRRLRPVVTATVDEFTTLMTAAFAQYEAGERITALPTIEPIPALVGPLTDLLVGDLEPGAATELRPQVQAALAAGNTNDAMTLVLPRLRDAEVAASADRLETQSERSGIVIEIDEVLRPAGDDPVARMLERGRTIVGNWLPLARALSALIGLAALGGLALLAYRTDRRPVHTVGATLVVGGAVLGGLWLVARLLYGDPLAAATGSDSGLPRELRLLISDLADSAFSSLDSRILSLVLLTTVAGALVLLGAAAVPAWRSGRLSRGRKIAVVAVGAIVALSLFDPTVVVTVGGTEASSVQRCNGEVELCDSALDDVVFVGAHNAMSASSLSWISANHDIDIREQLELGVRALLVDLWTWDTPDRLEEFGAEEALPPAYQQQLETLIGVANPYRPGTWMCHGVCKLGATRAKRAFGWIAEFLDRNPNEVVIVIVEDHVPARAVQDAVRSAGLSKYAFAPDRDPEAPWPTLREMIEQDKRLVIFAERAGGDAPWYRAGYDYMMETPYTFLSPDAMSCAPNRGGEGKRLFLMNHWIQKAAPSRGDAGLVNSARFIVRRARECERARGAVPNIVAADFVNLGAVTKAVQRLNAEGAR